MKFAGGDQELWQRFIYLFIFCARNAYFTSVLKLERMEKKIQELQIIIFFNAFWSQLNTLSVGNDCLPVSI